MKRCFSIMPKPCEKKIKNLLTIIIVEGRNISNDKPGMLHP